MVDRRKELHSDTKRRIEDRPARLDDDEPRGLDQSAQVARRSELRFPPDGITAPSADPSFRSPQAPLVKVADHELSARLEDTRHFRDSVSRIVDEAQRRHGDDPIETSVWIRQLFGRAFQESSPNARANRAAPSFFNHGAIGVDARDNRFALSQRHGEFAVATSNIENGVSIDGCKNLQKQPIFKCVSDLT